MDFSKVKKVVTHIDGDGIACAMIARRYLGEGVPILFVNYGEPARENMPAEPGLLFTDITPPTERAAEFAAAGALVIDHHEPKAADLDCFPRDQVCLESGKGVCAATILAREMQYAKFLNWDLDMSKTGTPSRDPLVRHGENHRDPVLEFARLVAVRDTWQTDSPDWEAACRLYLELEFWPFEKVTTLGARDWVKLWGAGEVLVQRRQKEVDTAILNAFTTTIDDKVVTLFQNTRLSSDTAERLGEEADIVVGYDSIYAGEKFYAYYSMRSHTGVDVSKIARPYGGGGHKAAAGFQAELYFLYNPVHRFLNILRGVDRLGGTPWRETP